MIVTIVYVHVKKEHLADFIQATEINHRESVKESGNLRFDILHEVDDPGKFTLYEAYVSEEAVIAHKQTTHYNAWRETVEPWMAGPRKGVKHLVLFPEDLAQW